MRLCPYQELCINYTNNTKRRSHHIRITDPCKHWLLFDCEKIDELMVLQEYITGQPVACNIGKVKRIKGELK